MCRYSSWVVSYFGTFGPGGGVQCWYVHATWHCRMYPLSCGKSWALLPHNTHVAWDGSFKPRMWWVRPFAPPSSGKFKGTWFLHSCTWKMVRRVAFVGLTYKVTWIWLLVCLYIPMMSPQLHICLLLKPTVALPLPMVLWGLRLHTYSRKGKMGKSWETVSVGTTRDRAFCFMG